MSGFIYFVQGLKKADLVDGDEVRLDVLAARKLPLADCRRYPDDLVITDVQNGPEKSSNGVVLVPVPPRGEIPGMVGFEPESQNWRQAPGGWYFIGWQKSSKILPTDLERATLRDGYYVEDAHGRQWICVNARGKGGGVGSLPSQWRFNGAARQEVLSEYERLYSDALKVHDHFSGGTIQSALWLARVAIATLSVNYRLDEFGIDTLAEMGCGILSTDFEANVLIALIDHDATVNYIELKKTLTASPSPPSG